MDFFKFATIYAEPYIDFKTVWVLLLVGGLSFAVVYVFEAIALFTIASREGFKHKWMAFIPFFNTYYIGVCAQKNRFYNIDTKKIGIAAAVFEFVLCALYIVDYVAKFLILRSGEPMTESTDLIGNVYYYYVIDSVAPNLKWAAWMYNYMERYILSILELLFLVLQISLLICFFQTYACRRYFLFTITSILFPIQGIMFFVVRNNKGVNYKEYLKAEQAKQYQMYQQYYQQNYNRNPYDRNPYNRTPYDNPPSGDGNNNNSQYGGAPDDPFGGLGSDNNSDNSPFDDFDKN